MKRKMLAAVLSLAMMVVMVNGCGGSSQSSVTPSSSDNATVGSSTGASSSGGKHYTFGFTEWGSAAFFDSVYASLEEVIKENGDTVIHAEGQADATTQQGIIENFIAQKVDLVFYNPVDTAASAAAIKALKEAGIPVVNFDAAVSDLSMVDAFVATDNFKAGQLCGEKLIKDFPNGGDIAVLDLPANTAATDRANGFLDAIKGKNFNVVAQLDGKGNTETAQSQADDILTANPKLIAIFGINDDSALGAYAAVTSAGEDVKIYGVNGSPEAKQKINEGGIFMATAAQSTSSIGRESALVAYKILNGEKFEHTINVSPFIIDSTNIEKYIGTEWQ
jgi:ribose transport system substrate-binding protein